MDELDFEGVKEAFHRFVSTVQLSGLCRSVIAASRKSSELSILVRCRYSAGAALLAMSAFMCIVGFTSRRRLRRALLAAIHVHRIARIKLAHPASFRCFTRYAHYFLSDILG